MKIIHIASIAVTLLLLLVIAVSCIPSWTYDIDTVQFILSNPQPKTDKPAPGVWIDTNVEISGMLGGTIKSFPPFDVAFNYTDVDRLYARAELTSITITYDDATIEKATDNLKLPLHVGAREYESVNSMSGGEIVKSKHMLISGRISGVITHEKPFTLKLKGHFKKQDGAKVSFEIDQHYDVKKETGKRSWSEVMKDL